MELRSRDDCFHDQTAADDWGGPHGQHLGNDRMREVGEEVRHRVEVYFFARFKPSSIEAQTFLNPTQQARSRGLRLRRCRCRPSQPKTHGITASQWTCRARARDAGQANSYQSNLDKGTMRNSSLYIEKDCDVIAKVRAKSFLSPNRP